MVVSVVLQVVDGLHDGDGGNSGDLSTHIQLYIHAVFLVIYLTFCCDFVLMAVWVMLEENIF